VKDRGDPCTRSGVASRRARDRGRKVAGTRLTFQGQSTTKTSLVKTGGKPDKESPKKERWTASATLRGLLGRKERTNNKGKRA